MPNKNLKAQIYNTKLLKFKNRLKKLKKDNKVNLKNLVVFHIINFKPLMELWSLIACNRETMCLKNTKDLTQFGTNYVVAVTKKWIQE